MSVQWILTDRQGQEHLLPAVQRGEVDRAEDAPADSAAGTFAVRSPLPEGAFLKILDGCRTIFEGPVDEQTRLQNQGRELLRLQARSRASLLLDNEAKPGSFFYPSLGRLWREYWKELGFPPVRGDERVFPGELVIRKGSSRWGVLEAFCRQYLEVTPRVGPDGVIDATGEVPGEEVWAGRGRLLRLTERLLPRELVSEVISRTFADGEYGVKTVNEKAASRGIRRVRYLNEAEGVKPSSRRLLQELNRRYHTVEAAFRGILPLNVGDTLWVEGFPQAIRVTGVTLQWQQGTETTVIKGEVTDHVDG